jgi:hypothetical protein
MLGRLRCALAAAVLIFLTASCSVHNDPHYNPYAAPRGEPRLLESADAAMEAAEQALNNVDQRVENGVY